MQSIATNRFLIIQNTFINHLMPNLRTPMSLILGGLSPLFIYLVTTINISGTQQRFGIISGYLLFAILSGSLTSASSTVAMDKAYGWGSYLQSMPAPQWPRIIGTNLANLIITLITIAPMVFAFLFSTPEASIINALLLINAIIPTSVTFIFLGITIGNACRPENTAYTSTSIYILMATLGGLFSGGGRLSICPEIVYYSMPSLWAYRFFSDTINQQSFTMSLFLLIATTGLWSVLIKIVLQLMHTCKVLIVELHLIWRKTTSADISLRLQKSHPNSRIIE